MRVPFDDIEHEDCTDARYEGRPFTGTAFDERNGILLAECDFVAGQLSGQSREFYPDGSLQCIEHYRAGKEHGSAQSFFADGRLERDAVYDEGLLVREVEYAATGQKVNEYDDAAGIRSEWRLDGSLRKVTVYEREVEPWGRGVREERYFDADGQPTVVHGPTGWAVAKTSGSATEKTAAGHSNPPRAL